MTDDAGTESRSGVAGLPSEAAPAGVLQRDAALLGRLLACAKEDGTTGDSDAGNGDGPHDDVAVALGLFEDMRTAMDRLETQVVIGARRRGMEWRQIAHCQGLKSSQAASQRYQRLMTRLEEIRQGIR